MPPKRGKRGGGDDDDLDQLEAKLKALEMTKGTKGAPKGEAIGKSKAKAHVNKILESDGESSLDDEVFNRPKKNFAFVESSDSESDSSDEESSVQKNDDSDLNDSDSSDDSPRVKKEGIPEKKSMKEKVTKTEDSVSPEKQNVGKDDDFNTLLQEFTRDTVGIKCAEKQNTEKKTGEKTKMQQKTEAKAKCKAKISDDFDSILDAFKHKTVEKIPTMTLAADEQNNKETDKDKMGETSFDGEKGLTAKQLANKRKRERQKAAAAAKKSGVELPKVEEKKEEKSIPNAKKKRNRSKCCC